MDIHSSEDDPWALARGTIYGAAICLFIWGFGAFVLWLVLS